MRTEQQLVSTGDPSNTVLSAKGNSMKKAEMTKSLVGIAGVHFVAAELSQRGFVATVTSRNTEGIDILAASPDGSRIASIQVKTSGAEQREKFSRSWLLHRKHEKVFSPRLFYVFVDLKLGDEKPDCYVVESRTVAKYIRTSHRHWLKIPSRTGKRHKDSDMRLFEIIDNKDLPKYLNRFDRIGLRR